MLPNGHFTGLPRATTGTTGTGSAWLSGYRAAYLVSVA